MLVLRRAVRHGRNRNLRQQVASVRRGAGGPHLELDARCRGDRPRAVQVGGIQREPRSVVASALVVLELVGQVAGVRAGERRGKVCQRCVPLGEVRHLPRHLLAHHRQRHLTGAVELRRTAGNRALRRACRRRLVAQDFDFAHRRAGKTVLPVRAIHRGLAGRCTRQAHALGNGVQRRDDRRIGVVARHCLDGDVVVRVQKRIRPAARVAHVAALHKACVVVAATVDDDATGVRAAHVERRRRAADVAQLPVVAGRGIHDSVVRMDVREAHEIDAINLPTNAACPEVERVVRIGRTSRATEVVGVVVIRDGRALCATVDHPPANVRAVVPCAIDVLCRRPCAGRGVAPVQQGLRLHVAERHALAVVADIDVGTRGRKREAGK